MDCCPSADFTFFLTGVEVVEKNIQADAKTHQFFSFKAIKSVTYNHTKHEGGLITIYAFAISRYTFPCSEAGLIIYRKIVDGIST